MSSHISVSFFPVNNEEGSLLKEKVRSLVEDELDLNLKIYEAAAQKDFFYSCVQDDIVIFDASIETGDNYAIATAQPTVMDHVIIVSRTYLPLNFFGIREGGAPEYPKSKSNEDIIKWLREQIIDLKQFSPRSEAEKRPLGSIKTMDKSINLQESRRKKAGQIFISYRSRYYEEVNILKSKIQLGEHHNGNEKTVRLFPPGVLVYEDEILTEQRCWQLVSMIDRTIRASEEFWIYNTDDYFDSWWTRAEVITLCDSDLTIPRIRIYNPKNETVCDAGEDYLPEMTKEQKKRLARWYSNCDPATMGPESLQAMRTNAKLPLIGRIKYFHDHVWSEEFWTNNLVPCLGCRNISGIPRTFDIDAFLWIKGFSYISLTPDQLQEALKKERFICPKCGSIYSFEEDKHPRFLWIATRMQKTPVNVFEKDNTKFSNLARLPVYRAHSL